jgi:VCBS repeat-containing protein
MPEQKHVDTDTYFWNALQNINSVFAELRSGIKNRDEIIVRQQDRIKDLEDKISILIEGKNNLEERK